MDGFEAERSAAKRAIESLGLRPLMADTAPSSPEPSKHALLPLVAQADLVVLILGARYGWVGPDGRSPTEDEYLHAVSSNVPVLAFVQQGVEREPAQDEFIRRVSGGWEHGRFRTSFSSAEDLGFQVVAAINALQRDGVSRAAQPEAQMRATSLAAAEPRRAGIGGPYARVVFVPVGTLRALDALTLDDPSLADRLAGTLRSVGLVSQSQAIESETSSAGVVLRASAKREPSVVVSIAADGSVVVEGPAGTAGNAFLQAFSAPRIHELARQAGQAACAIWDVLPSGNSVRQVAVTLAVPEPAHLPLSLSGVVGNSMQMGSFPAAGLVAPNPPQVVPRERVPAESTARLLAVSLKQLFVDRSTVIE